MDPTHHKKIYYSLGVLLFFMMIIIPDVIIGFVIEILHALWELFVELIHISFEGIESMLDHMVEETFHTDLHATQIIVFYIMMIFIMPIVYFLWRLLLRKTKNLIQSLNDLIIIHDDHLLNLYWHNTSMQKKIGWGFSTLIVIYLSTFLFM